MAVRVLAPLTLDAVRAESIALDLRMVRGQSPFDPTLSEGVRISTLNDQLSVVFKEAFLSDGDPVILSKNLITLAAHALAWAQMLDNAGRKRHVHAPYCGCPAGVSDAEGVI